MKKRYFSSLIAGALIFSALACVPAFAASIEPEIDTTSFAFVTEPEIKVASNASIDEPEINAASDAFGDMLTDDYNPTVEQEIDEGMGSGIDPYNSYLIVDEAVTSGGSDWIQPSDFCSYRVWVENTTNEQMTVTVSSAGGTFTRYVAANSNAIILTVNNAAEGYKHTVNFTTPSGTISGTVRVRVSDVKL